VSKRTNANSLGIYDNMDDLKEVHGHAGATEGSFLMTKKKKKTKKPNTSCQVQMSLLVFVREERKVV